MAKYDMSGWIMLGGVAAAAYFAYEYVTKQCESAQTGFMGTLCDMLNGFGSAADLPNLPNTSAMLAQFPDSVLSSQGKAFIRSRLASVPALTDAQGTALLQGLATQQGSCAGQHADSFTSVTGTWNPNTGNCDLSNPTHPSITPVPTGSSNPGQTTVDPWTVAIAALKSAAGNNSENYDQWAWYWQNSAPVAGAPAGYGVPGSLSNQVIGSLITAGGAGDASNLWSGRGTKITAEQFVADLKQAEGLAGISYAGIGIPAYLIHGGLY